MKLSLEHLIRSGYGTIFAMPNISERPIVTLADLAWYRDQVDAVLEWLNARGLIDVRYYLKLTNETTPEIIRAAAKIPDVVGSKYYPVGTTTNSQDGIANLHGPKVVACLEALEETGLVFSGHFEKAGVPDAQAEQEAIPDFMWLASRFPKLRIVFEHASSREAIRIINVLARGQCEGRLAATLAIHHALTTQRDADENPHNYCKPKAKTRDDRDAVLEAAFSSSSWFMAGDDSAPHLKVLKECATPKAGVYNAPVSLPLWVEEFGRCRRMNRLDDFLTRNAENFFGLPRTCRIIKLQPRTWQVPTQYSLGNGDGEVVPFMAGSLLSWEIVQH